MSDIWDADRTCVWVVFSFFAFGFFFCEWHLTLIQLFKRTECFLLVFPLQRSKRDCWRWILIQICVHAPIVNKDEHSSARGGGRGCCRRVTFSWIAYPVYAICYQQVVTAGSVLFLPLFGHFESRGMFSGRKAELVKVRRGVQFLMWLLLCKKDANRSGTTRLEFLS